MKIEQDEKFNPANVGGLTPFDEVSATGDVSEDDIAEARQQWRDNPPDSDYDGLLDAEVE